MKKLSTLPFYLLLWMSLFGISNAQLPESRPPHLAVAGRMLDSVVDHMQAAYDLQVGSKGGAMPKDIERLSLGFDCYRKVNRNEARKLIVSCEEDFIRIVNADPEAATYLRRYPADEKIVDMYIVFREPSGYSACSPYVKSVSVFSGEVTYEYKTTSEQLRFDRSETETFAEAQAIIHGNSG